MSSSTTEPGSIDVPMPADGHLGVRGHDPGLAPPVGDAVVGDEPICDISTDKIDTEFPAPAAGTLAEILVEAGRPSGSVIARSPRIAPAGANADARRRRRRRHRRRSGGSAAARRPTPACRNPSGGSTLRSCGGSRRTWHRPDPIAGSGRDHRVTKTDVLAPARTAPTAGPRARSGRSTASPRTAPTRPSTGPPVRSPRHRRRTRQRAEPLSRMRRTSARRCSALSRRRPRATPSSNATCQHVESRRQELGVTALPLVARHGGDACAASRTSTPRSRARRSPDTTAGPPRDRRLARR